MPRQLGRRGKVEDANGGICGEGAARLEVDYQRVGNRAAS